MCGYEANPREIVKPWPAFTWTPLARRVSAKIATPWRQLSRSFIAFREIMDDPDSYLKSALIMRRRKILIVHANENDRHSVAVTLRVAGYEIDTASTGSEAVRLIDRHTYSLVLSDLRMHGLDGPTLYRKIAARRPDAPPAIVFLSESPYASDYAAFLMETGVSMLTKPLVPGKLWQAVEGTLLTRSRTGTGLQDRFFCDQLDQTR
jgi:CheY-like chemotaxis protein